MSEDGLNEEGTGGLSYTSTGARRGKAPAGFRGNFGPTLNAKAQDHVTERPQFREGGGRIFVGNLESENISKEDFKDIFSKYGEVVEVSMHRSYGFVQFAREEDMQRAMREEQGRMIGSKPVDIQIAQQKDHARSAPARGGRGGMASNVHGTKRRYEDEGYQMRGQNQRYRTDEYGQGYANKKQTASAAGQVVSPVDGIVVKIILLGDKQRHFAEEIGHAIGNAQIPWDIEMLDGRTLSKALRDCEANKSRYALIVGRENLQKGTITIKLLHLKEVEGRCPTFDLDIDRLVDLIVAEERKLGFNEAGGPAFTSAAPVQSKYPASSGIVQTDPNANALSSIQAQLASLTQQLQNIAPQGQQQLAQPTLYNQQPIGQFSQPQMSNPSQYLGNPNQNFASLPRSMMNSDTNSIYQGQQAASSTTPANPVDVQEKIAQLQKLLASQMQQLQGQSVMPSLGNQNYQGAGNFSAQIPSYVSNPNLSFSSNLPSSTKPTTSSQLADLSHLLQTIKKAKEAGR